MKSKTIALLSVALVALASVTVWAVTSSALPLRLKYSVTNVTTSAYVELVHSTVKGLKGLSVMNSGPNPVQVAIGSVGAESPQVVAPGSAAAPAMVVLPVGLGYGTRISVIALDGTNSTGELEVNLLYN